MSWSFSCVALIVLLCALVEASAADPPQPGVCMRDGARLAGMQPVKVGSGVSQPRKIRNATPKYPDIPRGTTVRGGPWVGEILIDRQGAVREVWTTREVAFIPPFPAFNQAIVDAFRQWRFDPLVVQRQRVPVCTTVSHFINWS